MLINIKYNRSAVLEYAEQWALKRNPKYLDFETIGGDCTNFASQCLFAGSKVMNYTPVYGWYYNSAGDRSASWTGVQYLYNFLINNKDAGPYAETTEISQLEHGDLIQLGTSMNSYYHSLIVTGIENRKIYVATHSFDAYMRPLDSYLYDNIRYIHILGVRKYQ